MILTLTRPSSAHRSNRLEGEYRHGASALASTMGGHVGTQVQMQVLKVKCVDGRKCGRSRMVKETDEADAGHSQQQQFCEVEQIDNGGKSGLTLNSTEKEVRRSSQRCKRNMRVQLSMAGAGSWASALHLLHPLPEGGATASGRARCPAPSSRDHPSASDTVSPFSQNLIVRVVFFYRSTHGPD